MSSSHPADPMEGLRGFPVLSPDGTQGMPTRATRHITRKGGDRDGWTAFDLKLAEAHGIDRSEMNRRREASRLAISTSFRACVESLVADGVISAQSRDRFFREDDAR